MYIHGQFDNINGVRYTVHIVSDNDTTTEKVIGEDGLYFSEDPVTISQDNTDTFEHILKKSATINLITEDYIGATLFSPNARSVQVTIYRGQDCVFAGFVEPSTFNQPYHEIADEFTLNCIDALSTLQYYNYKNTTVNNFDEKRKQADVVTFKSILNDALDDLMSLDPITYEDSHVFYDQSKGISSSRTATVFDDLSVSDVIFIGDDADSVMTKEDTLTEILKYLNLHIVQEGFDYYIYDLNTLRNSRTSWYDLTDDDSVTLSATTTDITESLMGGDDTNITIGDVYNQVKVTDKILAQDDLFESPLDDDSLTNVTPKVRFMRWYWCQSTDWPDHYTWWAAFYQNINDLILPTLEKAQRRDHYIQFCTNKNWKLYYSGDTTVDDVYASGYTPYNIAKIEQESSIVPMIIKFGHIDSNAGTSDNSIINNVDMTPWLVISCNGNGVDTAQGQYPSGEMLRDKAPIAEYVGQTSAGCFSPLRDDETNYLVFGGAMQFQSYTQDSETYQHCLDAGATPSLDWILNHVVYDQFFSTRKWYTGYDLPITPYYVNENSFNPPNTLQTQLFPYRYTTDGYIDQFSKLPILECEMTIGNKRLVETEMDMYGNSKFGWYTIGQEPIEGGERKTTFSLGVNPKIGDLVIGQEYDIQNTISIDMNLEDVKGTAIPIKKSDNLTGAITFKILGPVNLWWTESEFVQRFYPWWAWNQTQYSIYAVLSHVENILIKDFTCKLVQGNADVNTNANNTDKNNDLVYSSAETDNFVNTKDDIEFNIVTQISATEAIQKGVDAKIALNAVLNNYNSNMPLESLYNATTNETARAEEHYVDGQYRECSSPKIVLETELLMNTNNTLSWRNKYYNHNLNKTFYVQGYELNAEKDTKTFTLKEL